MSLGGRSVDYRKLLGLFEDALQKTRDERERNEFGELLVQLQVKLGDERLAKHWPTDGDTLQMLSDREIRNYVMERAERLIELCKMKPEIGRKSICDMLDIPQ
jgi:hypothetical protein